MPRETSRAQFDQDHADLLRRELAPGDVTDRLGCPTARRLPQPFAVLLRISPMLTISFRNAGKSLAKWLAFRGLSCLRQLRVTEACSSGPAPSR